MNVYQALSADPTLARAFLTYPVARRELWLKVKFAMSSWSSLRFRKFGALVPLNFLMLLVLFMFLLFSSTTSNFMYSLI